MNCCKPVVLTLTILTLFSSSILAKECVLRRMGLMVEQPDYRAPNISLSYQIRPQLETNLTLFRLKKDGTTKMDLANKVSIDKKNRTMKVELKKTCGWSDGTVIDAYAILRGIQLYFEKKQPPYVYANFFKNAQSVLNKEAPISQLGVRVIDDFTLEFDLTVPSDLLQQALSYPVFTPAPIHLLKNNPDAWPVKSIVRISSGAYKAIKHEDNGRIIMRPNPYFCSGLDVNFDRIEIVPKKEQSSFIKSVLLNETDIAFNVNKKQAKYLLSNQVYSINYTIGEYGFDSTITLNINSEKNNLLKSEPIRQAISLVIDRHLINKLVMPYGTSTTTLSPLMFRSDYNVISLPNSSLEFKEKRLKAKKIMRSLGYSENQMLKLTFIGSKNKIFQKIQHLIASKLEQIYIQVELKEVDDKQHWLSRENGDYDLILSGWIGDIFDPSSYIEGLISISSIPEHLLKVHIESLKNTYFLMDKRQRMTSLARIESSIINSFYIIPIFSIQHYFLLRPDFSLLDEPFISARNIINKNCSSLKRQLADK